MKIFKNLKLRGKLIGGGAFAVLIPMLIVGVISVNTASKALIESGGGMVTQVAADLAVTTEMFLEGELKFAKGMVMTPLLVDTMNKVAETGKENALESIQALDQYFGKVHGKIGADYDLFFVSDEKGFAVSDSTGGTLRKKRLNIADRDYFKAARAGKSIIGIPVMSKASNMPVVVLSVPIKTKSGEFAVVANEIKALAKQTSDASMDIKAKIDNIQDSSCSALTGMDEISMVITEVSDIVSTIAAAVEEQSSATMEIAENISQASTGIEEVNLSVSQSSMVAQEITKDINTVNQSSRQMADRSGRVSLSAEDLSRLSGKLDQMVSRFKV